VVVSVVISLFLPSQGLLTAQSMMLVYEIDTHDTNVVFSGVK